MKHFIVIFILSFGFHAFANLKTYDISFLQFKKGESKSSNNICFIPDLSEQQEFIIEQIRQIHLSDATHIKVKIKKYKKAYDDILFNKKDETAWRADEASDRLVVSQVNLKKQQTIYFHAVYYQVLLGPQRSYLTNCL